MSLRLLRELTGPNWDLTAMEGTRGLRDRRTVIEGLMRGGKRCTLAMATLQRLEFMVDTMATGYGASHPEKTREQVLDMLLEREENAVN